MRTGSRASSVATKQNDTTAQDKGNLKSPDQGRAKRSAEAPQPLAPEAPQRRSNRPAKPTPVSPEAKPTKRKAAVEPKGRHTLGSAAQPLSVESSSSSSEEEDPNDGMQEAAAAGRGTRRRQDHTDNGEDSDQNTADEDEESQHVSCDQDDEQCDAVDLLGGQAIDDGALKQLYRSLPVKNANAKQGLLHSIKCQQDSWHLSLRQGFSLWFQGFGSKLSLMENFGRDQLTDGGVLAFKGWMPKTTVKEVITVTAQHMLQRPFCNKDLLALIDEIAAEPVDRHMYLIIHNIEGPGLRGELALLSRLASCHNIHLLASSDHVNAALLQDLAANSRFRWRYVSATTYAAYTAETLDMPSILNGSRQSATRATMSTVLCSFVANSREVFRVLAEAQMDDPAAEGVSFAHLFRMSRERFLVSKEAALRTHLTEFIDHDLIKLKTSSEGIEVMVIPLDNAALTIALSEMDDAATAADVAG